MLLIHLNYLIVNACTLCLNISDSYEKGQEKALLAEDTSNIETESSDVEKRKSREKRRRDRSPSSSCDEAQARRAKVTQQSTNKVQKSARTLPMPPGMKLFWTHNFLLCAIHQC